MRTLYGLDAIANVRRHAESVARLRLREAQRMLATAEEKLRQRAAAFREEARAGREAIALVQRRAELADASVRSSHQELAYLLSLAGRHQRCQRLLLAAAGSAMDAAIADLDEACSELRNRSREREAMEKLRAARWNLARSIAERRRENALDELAASRYRNLGSLR